MSLLRTQGLSRYFGGLQAVDQVDFDLQQGEIRAIIGPNGAGKTTFVSMLSGRLEVTSGSILFDGEDITMMPAWKRVRRGIAYTFQITSIYPKLTVFENVAIAAQGCSSVHDVDSLVTDLLVRMGLADLTDEIAGTMAYGHQRLLEVAMGLALKPKLLILDEPTQGLSDAEIAEFCDLVRAIASDATVLLIEHNMSVVMSLAHQITVFDHGRIIAEGSPEEVRASAAVQSAYLGTES